MNPMFIAILILSGLLAIAISIIVIVILIMKNKKIEYEANKIILETKISALKKIRELEINMFKNMNIIDENLKKLRKKYEKLDESNLDNYLTELLELQNGSSN